MPGYPLPGDDAARLPRHRASDLGAQRIVGVPYTDEMIDNAKADLEAQADPTSTDATALAEALPQGAGAQASTASQARASPRWMRWSPICRCSARWSTSPDLRRRRSQCDEADHDASSTTAARADSGAGHFLSLFSPSCALRALAGQQGDVRARSPLPLEDEERDQETMAMTHKKIDQLTGVETTGHEWDGIGAQQATAAVVAVDLLCCDRLVDWLLGRLSRLADLTATPGRARLSASALRWRRRGRLPRPPGAYPT